MIVVGRFALVCCLVFSLGTVALLALGVRRRRRDLMRAGYLAVYGLFFSVVVASSVLLAAFVGRDFSFAYVAENSDSSLSVFYRIAGFWAGQQGSFLLWLLLLSVITVVIALRNVESIDRLTAAAVGVLAAVAAVFSVLMVADRGSNPFLVAGAAVVPQGLNPLLLHPAMVLHPPALFAGYAGLTVPFAFATAALLLGGAERDWALGAQKWTVAGWTFLTLGIGLGAWWAYVVLSFGGYWAWDPVENTSLIPWLTATALLHSMTLYRRRGLLRRSTLAFACATFWLTLVATWTTRTDLITSVHAFPRNDTLTAILSTLLAVVAAVSIGLLAWRWRRFGGQERLVALSSRDVAYYLSDVALGVFAAALLIATVVVPLATDRTVGPDTYRLFAEPLGVAVVAAIALCPLLALGRASGHRFRRVVRWPLLVAALALPLLLATGDWRSSLFGLVGLEVCCFAAAAVVTFIVASARRAAGEQGLLTGLRRALTASRARTAAYVAHAGVILILAGLLGSNVYRIERSAYLPARAGATAQAGGYTLRFTGFSQGAGAQGAQRFSAHFVVTRDGRRVGLLAPYTDVYPQAGAADRAVILGSLPRDLFVVAQDPFDSASTHLRLQLDVFPLVRLVWAGVILLVAGGGVSLWPGRERAPVAALEPRDKVPEPRDKVLEPRDGALEGEA
jgi:cytochrome c-type biogenesis protein CcmF